MSTSAGSPASMHTTCCIHVVPLFGKVAMKTSSDCAGSDERNAFVMRARRRLFARTALAESSFAAFAIASKAFSYCPAAACTRPASAHAKAIDAPSPPASSAAVRAPFHASSSSPRSTRTSPTKQRGLSLSPPAAADKRLGPRRAARAASRAAASASRSRLRLSDCARVRWATT